MSKIGSGFMLFKALARTPSSTIVIRWWFITRCKCRFCKRLCVNVPLACCTTKRPTKVNIRAALAVTGSSDGHEAQKPIALFWRKKQINSKLFFFSILGWYIYFEWWPGVEVELLFKAKRRRVESYQCACPSLYLFCHDLKSLTPLPSSTVLLQMWYWL